MKKIFTLIFALGLFAMANANEISKFRTHDFGEAVPVARYEINKDAVVNTPKFAPAAELVDIPVTGFTTVEIAWYPSMSSEGALFHEIFLYNDSEEDGWLPQAAVYIYTDAMFDFYHTFSSADGSIELKYCGLYIVANNAQGYEGITPTAVTFTMAEVDDDNINFSAKFVQSKVKTYTFDFTTDDLSYSDAEHTYEPLTPQTLDLSFASATVDMDFVEKGVIYIDFEEADGSFLELAYLLKDEEAGATEMPNGTFGVSDEDQGTFLAGSYYYNSTTKQSYPVLSYALIKIDEQYSTPYYITDGTVTVSGSGNDNKKFDVNLKSFYGTEFKFKFPSDSQGIENTTVDTKTTKVVRDGQIYIIRDGKMFNAIGTQVK